MTGFLKLLFSHHDVSMRVCLCVCLRGGTTGYAIKVNWILYAHIHSIHIQINTDNNLSNIVAVIVNITL